MSYFPHKEPNADEFLRNRRRLKLGMLGRYVVKFLIILIINIFIGSLIVLSAFILGGDLSFGVVCPAVITPMLAYFTARGGSEYLEPYYEHIRGMWFICENILLVGFLLSWYKFLNDDAWFARSGGVVTIISAYSTFTAGEFKVYAESRMDWEFIIGQKRRYFNNQSEEKIYFLERDKKIARLFESQRQDEFVILGVGSLVWALGDLIKFVPRTAFDWF